MGFNYDGRFCHDWFNHISFLFLRVQQSVSALDERLHELKTVFFCGFFFCRYTPPDVRVRSRLSAHICVCVFMRMCVKHVGVRLQTSVFVPVICVCPCISVSLCVCMNAQAQIRLVKVIFPFRTVRFLRTLCTCAYVREFGVYRCTSACKKPESHCEWTPVTVASSCTVEDCLNVPEQDAIRGGAAGQ